MTPSPDARSGRGLAAALTVALAALLLLPTATALAQSLSFAGAGKNKQPIQIYSSGGIEWQQGRLLFIARGNARAVRGDVTVYGDELRAYYRNKPQGGSEIWRLDAVGHVRITSKNETAYGDHAIYDVDHQILTIRGKMPHLVAGQDVISASRQLEYWETKQMAVARGNATAVRTDLKTKQRKEVKADILAAYFHKDKAGQSKIYRVDAFDHVKVLTAGDTAMGDRGVYNVDSGIATLLGHVELLRQDNKLYGCRAEVNLNSGISHLYPCGGKGGRVSGVLSPKKH